MDAVSGGARVPSGTRTEFYVVFLRPANPRRCDDENRFSERTAWRFPHNDRHCTPVEPRVISTTILILHFLPPSFPTARNRPELSSPLTHMSTRLTARILLTVFVFE